MSYSLIELFHVDQNREENFTWTIVNDQYYSDYPSCRQHNSSVEIHAMLSLKAIWDSVSCQFFSQSVEASEPDGGNILFETHRILSGLSSEVI